MSKLPVSILVMIIASVSYCLAITEPSPCCKAGITAGQSSESENHERECTVSKMALSNKEKQTRSCTFMAKLCCKNALRTMHCGIGKDMAMAAMECSLLQTLQRSCCGGCKRGLAASADSCKKNSDTSMPGRAFQACCDSKKSNTEEKEKTKATTTKKPTKKTNKKTCADIACDSLTTTSCEETASGPKCICKAGFKVADDGINCEPPPKNKEDDKDDKKKKTCRSITCDRKTSTGCEETSSGPKCVCKSGYKQSKDEITCEDIDECMETDGVKLCHETYTSRYTYCMNFKGYYKCVYDCPSPRYYRPMSGVCKDVDECKQGTHNCDKKTHKCINRVGSYHCKRTGCKSGYKFVDGRCEEIDQCKVSPCAAGEYCYKYFGKRQCIPEKCPHKEYYEQRRPAGNDIAECSKQFCDQVRDISERKACWDADVYPSSLKRYAYKYESEIKYKVFKFNYWWNFDESKYNVETNLLGNENQDFYMSVRRNDLDVYNQREIKGPQSYKLIIQVDVKERTYQQKLIWRFQTHLYVNVA